LLAITDPAVMTEQSLRNFLLVSFFDMAHSLYKIDFKRPR
jgi:hypothetical protein